MSLLKQISKEVKRNISVPTKSPFNLMIDSGAHAVFENFVRCGTGIWDRHLWNWEVYGSPQFWQYVDDYAEFLKTYKDAFTVYVSMDAIYDPKTSYETFIYLREKHGLDPLPVYHYAEDIEWLKKYMEITDYVGISGLGQGIDKSDYIKWADRVFSLVCSGPSNLPTHKIHGFALTSPELIFRYPWWSVDSSSWVQFSQFGKIIVPKRKNGKRYYNTNPYTLFVSTRSPSITKEDMHFETLPNIEKEYVLDYLNSLGVAYGKSHFAEVPAGYKKKDNEYFWGKVVDGKRKIEIIEEYGVSNRHEFRDIVNFQFYTDLEQEVPEWPWAWKPSTSNLGFIKR